MSREQCPVELGDLARDGITGFTGVVTAITEWLNGCVRVTIQPAGLHEGKPDDSYTFDVERVKAVKGAGFNKPFI